MKQLCQWTPQPCQRNGIECRVDDSSYVPLLLRPYNFILSKLPWSWQRKLPTPYYTKQWIFWYCEKHIGPAGFCLGCGEFCGGIESFYFIPPLYYCDNCKDGPDLFPEEEYEDESDEYLEYEEYEEQF